MTKLHDASLGLEGSLGVAMVFMQTRAKPATFKLVVDIMILTYIGLYVYNTFLRFRFRD